MCRWPRGVGTTHQLSGVCTSATRPLHGSDPSATLHAYFDQVSTRHYIHLHINIFAMMAYQSSCNPSPHDPLFLTMPGRLSRRPLLSSSRSDPSRAAARRRMCRWYLEPLSFPQVRNAVTDDSSPPLCVDGSMTTSQVNDQFTDLCQLFEYINDSGR